MRPKAVICSEKSLQNALDARDQTKESSEIIVQNTSQWTFRNHTTNLSYISDREYPWEDVLDDFGQDRASVLVFSSGTTGSPKIT